MQSKGSAVARKTSSFYAVPEDEQMTPLFELKSDAVTSGLLQAEVGERGYVLIRGLITRHDIDQLLTEIADIIAAAGWLLPGHNPNERVANVRAACGDPDPGFKQTYQDVFSLAAFHALPHHPALRQVMKMIVGDQLLIHPKPIGRLIFPNCERLTVHAHQDYRFMGGDPECYTAWIPLHDCPAEVGPLQILEGSHRFGFLSHEDENLQVPEIPESAVVGGEWASGRINACDVLIFHSLTVHAASPNVSKQIRISLDCRFQDCKRDLNPGVLAFAGESGKSWEKIYSGWHSNDLKYYWKDLPLRFKPSKSELEELSMNAETPAVRARYARILSQIS
jgi:ectoine hydroxylase-related dioxygenase (phytanoyl-CoA dioxygenase family)